MKNKKRIILITLLLIIGLTLVCILKAIFYQPKATISVNYGNKIDELTKPKNYDPNENAAPIIDKALLSLSKSSLPDLTYSNKIVKIEMIHTKRFDHIKELIKNNERSLELLSQAAEKPYFWRKVDPSNSDGLRIGIMALWDFDRLINTLLMRAKLSEKDNISNSIADYMLAYKTSGYFEPLSLEFTYQYREYIIKNLTYAIQTNTMDTPLTKTIQDDLESYPPEDISLYIEIQKLISLDIIQRAFTDNGKGDGKLIIPNFTIDRTGSLGSIFEDIKEYSEYKRRLRKHDSRKVSVQKLNKANEKAKELSKLTPCQIFNKYNQTYQDILGKIVGNNYYAYGLFSDGYIQTSFHESICHRKALIAILGIKRYKTEKGNLPESLEKLLEDGYIKTIPMDPYSDKPLVYKLTDKSFVLYSIGRDFKDDGGKYTELEKWYQTEKDGDYIFWPVFPEENETPENTEIDSYFTDPNYPSGLPGGYPGMGYQYGPY